MLVTVTGRILESKLKSNEKSSEASFIQWTILSIWWMYDLLE